MALPPIMRVRDDAALPEAVDVAVIGGGIAGVAAAYYLAKAGQSVAVLEKGVIAGEQSSRNWGWCRVQNRDEREIPLMQRSLELWDGLRAETGGDYGFRRDGLVYVTRSQADMDRWQGWIDMARQYQVHSHMLTAQEARDATPGNDGAWIGGIASPQDGMADPFLAVPTLAEAARRAGATIHQRCAVRGLDVTAGRVTGVITEKGRIRAGAVLLAGGSWSSMMLRRHGVDLPQASIRSTVFLTQAAPEVTAGGVNTPEITISRRENGGYIVAANNRGRIELTPAGIRHARKFWPTLVSRWSSVSFGIGGSFFRGPDARMGNWSFDRPTLFEAEDMRILDPKPSRGVEKPALAQLARSWPVLAGTRAQATWGGWIDSTPDAVPVIAPIDALPGLFLSTGFSGHGFGIGPGAGRLAADLILGIPPVVAPEEFRLDRLVDGSPIREPGMI
jgi:glycine/D-amino acid oxidase-like deaminating enzyme